MPATENRDLASGELWQDSLQRSRRRRRLAANARKEQNRRKTASVAVSAAVAAAPMWPSVAGSGAFEASAGPAKGAKHPEPRPRVLLSFGDVSPSVAAVQHKLQILEDGIFGPQTEAAVRAFQKRAKLPRTGDVDIRTWLAMFPNDAIVAAAGDKGAPKWAALSTEPAADTTPAGAAATGPAMASALPRVRTGHSSVKPKQRRGHKAHASRSPVDDLLGTPEDSVGVPTDDKGKPLAPPSHDLPAVGLPAPPAEGSPPTSGGGAPARPVAPKPVAPLPVKPVVPIAPRGSVGQMIKAMIDAANRIDRARYPYRWGGGHNMRFSGPYDCSGAVSAVLHAAGLLRAPLVSGDFARWGAPGRGAVTIYANASHVYMSINGRFFGTSRSNPGGGAGWFRGAPRPGFTVVHVPFERMKLGGRALARQRAKRKARYRAYIRAPRKTAPQAPSAHSWTGTPAGGAAPPAASTPPATSTPTAPVRSAPVATGTPAPSAPVAGTTAPSAPAGGAPPAPSQPAPINVRTPAGSVTITPPPSPAGGGGSAGSGAPAQPPAPAGGAPVGAPTPPPAPSAPPAGTAPSGSGSAPSGQATPPAAPQPPASPPANPVGDAAKQVVTGVAEAAEPVTSKLAPKEATPPAAPDSGQAASGTG